MADMAKSAGDHVMLILGNTAIQHDNVFVESSESTGRKFCVEALLKSINNIR